MLVERGEREIYVLSGRDIVPLDQDDAIEVFCAGWAAYENARLVTVPVVDHLGIAQGIDDSIAARLAADVAFFLNIAGGRQVKRRCSERARARCVDGGDRRSRFGGDGDCAD